MRISLSCGAIGVRASQVEAIDLAHRHGFEAVEPQADYLEALADTELNALLDDLKRKSLVFGTAGLRVDFRATEERFERGMRELPKFARALQRVGATRVGAWIPPAHDSLTYLQYFTLHTKRLRQIAEVLGDHGLRLGLEYVGPKTSWSARRYPFIHSLAETRELIAEIGRPNVGLVLDSFHWYTAGETESDLRCLRNEDIVSVDLNDAPAGIAVDEQQDLRRELPAATGVIDVASFLLALRDARYDGPVRAEPFNAALRKLPREEAVAATIQAMKKAFALLTGGPPTGFVSIFNGRDLTGWHRSLANHHGDTQGWRVEDGILLATQDRPGNGGILLTDASYRDFEAYLEINPDFGCDGGLFLRSNERGQAYQVTIDYLQSGSVGGIWGEKLVGVKPPPQTNWEKAWRKGEWNALRARIEGNPPHITVWLNGERITDWIDTDNHAAGGATEGMIALQVHGGRRWVSGGCHRFRNIAVRRLGKGGENY